MDKVTYTGGELQPAQHFDTIVSSSSCISNDFFALREIIGFPTSTSTPYDSPHEVHLLVCDYVSRGNLVNSVTMPSLSADPGFTERTSPNGMNNGKFPRALSSPVLEQDGLLLEGHVENRTNDGSEKNLSKVSGSGANSNEESSVSEQKRNVETKLANNVMSSHKRKGSNSAKDEDGNAKRSKQTENRKKIETKTEGGGQAGCKEKATEPQKDYIHVRARRGEATDSHSLAERVRREKISERMTLLQDLVPGCNKVTGKALMLEEIINYVQSLQRQVEFMSMKLASVNSELEFNMDNILSKDMLQQNAIVPQQMYHLGSTTEAEAALYNNNDHQSHSHQNVQLLHNCNISSEPLSQCSLDHVPLDASLCSNLGIQLPSVDVFSDAVPQFTAAFGEDDLHNIIQVNSVSFPVHINAIL